MFNVLLVEDLEEYQFIVRRALSNNEIQLTVASTVKEALAFLNAKPNAKIDLAILDLGLPDGEGLSILETIRSTLGHALPVFLLTSDTELESKVIAFNLGADDYLIKPISGIELRARVEMRLKKYSDQSQTNNKLLKDDFVLDLTLMEASLQIDSLLKTLDLTAKEFKILALLMQNEERVYSRQDLVRLIWGNSVHVLERTVDSHIFGLRKKLADHAHHIECIPGIGYRFSTQPSEDASKKKIAH